MLTLRPGQLSRGQRTLGTQTLQWVSLAFAKDHATETLLSGNAVINFFAPKQKLSPET